MIAFLLAVLMAITQPGGAGTTIFIYDDSDTSGGRAAGPYTFAQISAAFPVDFVDNGTSRKSYRAKVSLQIGDGGTGTATTTLQDTNVDVTWDSTKTLLTRTTQATSWFITFGTKVGTGNQASGANGCHLTLGAVTNLRGTINLYGSIIRQTSGGLTWTASADGAGEAFNSLIASTASGTSPVSIGTFATRAGTAYNLDVTHSTAVFAMANFCFQNCERVTMGAPAPATYLQTAQPSFVLKDPAFFGTPTQSDLRWASAAATNWSLVRPRWTGNAPKFSMVGVSSISADNGTHEYWVWNIKTVARSGAAVAGIPVTLTDGLGNVQVSATTGADGQITYGSGLTANAIIVADHYATAGVYAIRHRSPFEFKCNTPDLAGYNPNYLSRHYKFYFPGYESVTTSGGTFEDMQDIVNLEELAGNPTTWVEKEMP